MYQINDLIIGKVIKIRPYAIFLQFEDGSQGLLHISELSDAFVKDIEKFGSVGDSLKVLVLAVDENNGFLRVSLKKVPKEEMFSSHVNSKTQSIAVEESSFQPLKDKLPEWIEETVKKAKGE